MNDIVAEKNEAGRLAAKEAAGCRALSVIVPVFNESETLPEFHRRLGAVLDSMPYAAEIVYVDDGSKDDSAAYLLSLHDSDPRVALLRLSRNFGKEAAMTAGLDHAKGDAVILIDADLQDPPEVIPDLVAPWAEMELRQGFLFVEDRDDEAAGIGG